MQRVSYEHFATRSKSFLTLSVENAHHLCDHVLCYTADELSTSTVVEYLSLGAIVCYNLLTDCHRQS